MTTPRRLGVLLTTSVVVSLAGPGLVTPADAAPARTYRDVATYYKATVEGCKVSVDGGTKWKVFARLDNTDNRRADKRRGSLTVVQEVDGEDTYRRRVDTGLVAGRTTSKVISLVIPKGDAYKLGVGVDIGQAGNGRTVELSALRRC